MNAFPDPARSRAVLLGVHTYRHLDQLPGVAGNIRELRAVLTDPAVWGLPPGNCMVPDGQPTTQPQVIQLIKQAAAEATDTLLVYYAGHGLFTTGSGSEELYLALPDMEPDDYCAAIDYKYIRDVVRGSRRQGLRTVVILDACYSGQALNGAMSVGLPDKRASEEFQRRADVDSACVLTACAATHWARAPVGESMTAFTKELVGALRHGVVGKGEHLNMLDLYEHLERTLHDKHLPVPEMNTHNSGAGIILARNRAYTPPIPESGEPVYAGPVNTVKSRPAIFLGRDAEVAGITEPVAGLALGKGPAVFVLHGMGGSGKSSLARAAAAQVADDFPDARIELDLDGFTPDTEPRTPRELLGQLLEHIGFRPNEIRDEEAARSEQWRAWLASRRVLLILDNARDAAQVAPLLPGARTSCLTIVTSRDRLDGIDAQGRIPVPQLAEDTAVELLAEVSGAGAADRPLLAEIATLVGGLPLALRPLGSLAGWVGAASVVSLLRSTSSPGLVGSIPATVSSASSASSKELKELAGVRLAFSVSRNQLTEDIQRLLRFCACHPAHDFDPGSVAALAGLDAATAVLQLDALAGLSMLLVEKGRYRFHDLYLHYAREEMDAHGSVDVVSARARLYAHLLAMARAALAELRGAESSAEKPSPSVSFAQPGSARAWLSAATQELIDAAVQALDERWEDAVALTQETARWLRLDDRSDQSKALLDVMLAEAVETDDRTGQAVAHWGLAEVARLREEFAAAALGYGIALKLYEEIGDRTGQAASHWGLGEVARLREKLDVAAHEYGVTLRLCEPIGHRRGQAQAHLGLADVARLREELDVAAVEYGAALELHARIGNRLGQAQSHWGLAEVARLRNEFDAAAVGYGATLELCEQIGDRRGQAEAHVGLADVARLREQFDTAAWGYGTTLKLYEQIGDRRGQAAVYWGLAEVARLREEFDIAALGYGATLDLYEQIGDRRGQAQAHGGLAEVARIREEFDAAVLGYGTALELCEQIGDRRGQAAVHWGLAEVARLRNELDAAAQGYCTTLKLYEQIGDLRGQAAVYWGLAEVARLRNEFDAAALGYCATLELYEQIGDRRGQAAVHWGLAEVARLRNDIPRASSEYLIARTFYQEIGNARWARYCQNRRDTLAL